MYRRQRILLYLISLLKKRGRKITLTFLDKLLFLMMKESDIGEFVKFYHFYPYKYGPFSNQYYLDLNDLKSHGYVDDNFNLTEDALRLTSSLNSREREIVSKTVTRFDEQDVVNYVYQKYPEYTIKSVIKAGKKESSGKPGIFSIGYEKKDIDQFLNILIQNGIEILIDVRAKPFSMNFSYTKNKLAKSLEKVDIEYMHVPQLGVPGEYRKQLETEEDYRKLFEFYKNNVLPKQIVEIQKLIELGKKRRMALMCFESDKNHCHRGVLSKALEEQGKISVSHL